MKRLSAVVGEYTDKQTNQQKAEWASVGVIGVSAKGKEYMLLNPEVSLAGLLVKQNVLAANKGEKLSDMVMISIIDEQAQNNNQNSNQQQGGFNNQQQAPAQQGGFNNQGNQQGGYQQR
ncbi:MAG: hypothetical protein HRU18_00755 [Pseudoalteromonas sp.]|uniref:hypothetical protein n=1 Tax=Pseudoalteromonas sp. TaxID=53249 RepID=UPI001D87CB7A|nr:hypothetical protein [Pseudoalteromonas sp.]NRA76709.1 hypothetical protein [Pseudoalteromonas sp.]